MRCGAVAARGRHVEAAIAAADAHLVDLGVRAAVGGRSTHGEVPQLDGARVEADLKEHNPVASRLAR